MNKFAQLRRVLSTQYGVASQRLSEYLPEYQATTQYFGRSFTYPSRSMIGRAVKRGHVWDAPLLDALRLVGEGSNFIDIGANIGATTRGVLHHRPDLEILAVEPSRRFLPFLQDNLAPWLETRVMILEVLIGPGGMKVDLITDPSTASVVQVDKRHYKRIVRQAVYASSLDSVCAEIRNGSLIKIDVDGYEGVVLASGKEVLSTRRPILFLEWTPSRHTLAGTDPRLTLDLLAQCGYRNAQVFSPNGQGIGSVRLSDLRVPEHQYVDLLLIPD